MPLLGIIGLMKSTVNYIDKYTKFPSLIRDYLFNEVMKHEIELIEKKLPSLIRDYLFNWWTE